MNNKQQIQELNDELGEMEVWEYMRSKKDLVEAIQMRELYNKTLGETPEDVLDAYIQHVKDEQANEYWKGQAGQ